MMGGPGAIRKALLTGGAIAASLLAVTVVNAQEAEGPQPTVNFTDPGAMPAESPGPALDVNVREQMAVRFSPTSNHELPAVQGPRRLELELAAGGQDAPVDFAIAQRASIGSDANGDVDRRGSGSELRVGRGLVGERENSRDGAIYMFVASDNEALTWQPGARTEFGGSGDAFSLQEQVEVGDMSAGVTYERNGIQASLAYVEREESTQVGNETYSQDMSFAGITVTMRR